MVFFPNWTGENFLSNFSFVFLFSTMLFYWVQTFFFSTPKWNVIGFILMAFSNLSLLTLLLLRWKESGHFPLSNLYESLLFLSWSLTSIHLFLTSISFKKTKGVFFNLEKKEVSSVFPLGALLSPCALFTNAFANFSLPDEMRNPSAYGACGDRAAGGRSSAGNATGQTTRIGWQGRRQRCHFFCRSGWLWLSSYSS